MPFIKNVAIFAKKVVAGGDTTPRPFPSTANNNSYVIKTNGRIFSWGSPLAGALGDNQNATARSTPGSITGVVKTFCNIVSGFYHASAIDKNGRAWSWGFNGSGQLGNNSTTCQLTPVSVLGVVKTFCQIHAVGDAATVMAIDKNGRAWGWGFNGGAIGNNSTTQVNTPVSVCGAVKTFCKIKTGGFTLAIDKNGRAWAWGNNGNGQLGDNSATAKCTPVSVAGATKTFCQISTGASTAVAIDRYGKIWTWGANSSGALGDGGSVPRSTPGSIGGAQKTFCKIAASGNFTIAIDKNGRAWGWGFNTSGQLGNNSTTCQLTPVSVLGAVKTFCEISSGGGNSVLAVDKNGKVWGWGSNVNGKLGDNTTLSRLTPVAVCTL